MKWLWLATLSVALSACGDDDGPPVAENRVPDAAALAIKVSNVGSACAPLARTCEGDAAQCMEFSYSGAFYAGGYCTADCKSSAECGLDGVCPVGEAQLNAPEYRFRATWARKCFKTCTPNSCRPGYACLSLAEAYEAPDAPIPMHTPVCIPRGSSATADAGSRDAAASEHGFDAGR